MEGRIATREMAPTRDQEPRSEVVEKRALVAGGRWTALLVFGLSLVVYLAVLPHRVDVLRPLPIDVPVPTGDEPYYLEVAHSLVYDRDLDLTNNQDRLDYYRFYPIELGPHRSRSAQPGHYSKHFPGLALLIAPWYAVGDQFWLGEVTGSRMVVAGFMGLLAALLAANLFWLAREVVADSRLAAAIGLGLALTNPFLSYAFLIFPALPAALLVVYAYRHARRRSGGLVRSLLVGLALGYLPWLHPRLALVAAPLALCFLLRARPRRWALLLYLAPLVGSALLMTAYDYWLYATPLPNLQDHAGMDFAGLPAGLVGSLVDQQWGLLIYAPFYILAGVGVVYSLRARPMAGESAAPGERREQPLVPERPWAEMAWIMAIVLPYALFIFSYRQWWGEWCPPARYLVPVLPLAVVPLARALAGGSYARTMYGLLLAISLGIGALLVINPRAMYNHPTGQAELLLWLQAHWDGLNLVEALPAVVAPNASTPWHVADWLIGFGFIAALTLWMDRQRGRKEKA